MKTQGRSYVISQWPDPTDLGSNGGSDNPTVHKKESSAYGPTVDDKARKDLENSEKNS